MIADLTLLLLCQLAGEGLTRTLDLPVPGPVLGLLLLLGLCAARHRLLDAPRAIPGGLRATAPGLLRHLALLFVPAGVGIVQHVNLIRAEWLAITVSLLLSTWLTIAVSAAVMVWATRRFAGGTAEESAGD